MAFPPDIGTFLVLAPVGGGNLVTYYSSRGLKQTLAPVASQVRRTVNGTAINLLLPQFRKYKSTISCNDQRPPAFDGWFPGMELIVSCIAELSYPVGGTPQRTVVSGSPFTESGNIFYRPQLTMLIADFKQDEDEWKAGVGWSLDLVER
jgi:hypothetical protein